LVGDWLTDLGFDVSVPFPLTSATRLAAGFSAPTPGGLTPSWLKLVAKLSMALSALAGGRAAICEGGDNSVLGEMYAAGSPLSGLRLDVGAAGENGAKVGSEEGMSLSSPIDRPPGTSEAERG
jgi:hypothetical protein